MALTPEDVRAKQFSTAKRRKDGYDPDEVDAFLDIVEAEVGALLRDNAELKGQVSATEMALAAAQSAAPAVVESAPAPAAANHQEAAVRMLELAQRTADEHVAAAKSTADRLVDEAREEAAKLTDGAREQAAQLTEDSRTERVDLEQKVEDLRGFEKEYRLRLHQHLDALVAELEHRGEGAMPPVPASLVDTAVSSDDTEDSSDGDEDDTSADDDAAEAVAAALAEAQARHAAATASAPAPTTPPVSPVPAAVGYETSSPFGSLQHAASAPPAIPEGYRSPFSPTGRDTAPPQQS